MLQKNVELKDLPLDASDIFYSNVIDYYKCRDISKWKNFCLVEFAATINVRSGNCRRNRRIIRWINYKFDVDPCDFYRENVLLFYPRAIAEPTSDECFHLFDANVALIASNKLTKSPEKEKQTHKIRKKTKNPQTRIKFD